MFAHKVIIVTGGGSSIGAATAEYFAKEGASVVIVDRDKCKLKTVAKRCEELGAKVLTIKADVSKPDEANTIIKKTIKKFGTLDVLVNNAGIVRVAKIDEKNALSVYDEIMKTNLRSVVQLTSLAVPHLKETKGNIINVSSVASNKAPFAGFGAYAISKAGMDHFTRSCAIELAPFGIRVNSVNPGPVATDITKTYKMPKELEGKVTPDNLTALGRISEAEEIADMILFLASDRARSITGSSQLIDNGFLLK